MSIVLVVMMILMYTLQSLFCKVYSDAYPNDKKYASSVFSIVSGVIVALATFCVAKFSFYASWQTILIGCINGVVLILYNTFMVKASENGPYSILMVFMLSGGIIIPAIVAVIMGDAFSIWKWLIILVIVIAIWMVSKKESETKVSSKMFFIVCFGLFITNGVYGMLFDLQQRILGVDEKEELIILTYGVMAIISLAFLSVSRGKKLLGDFKQTKKSALFLFLCSITVAVAINLLVYILPLIDVTILYTFDNSGVFVMSVIASCICFKEKLTKINVVGCIVMCASLICMSLL